MIINKLELNLKRCGITPVIDAVQEDAQSRGLELLLYDGEDQYLLPGNLAVLIHYKKADGKGGEYDTMPDGHPAWSARRNKLTILLTHQMFTFPGSVSMTVSLISDGAQLGIFPIQINVLPKAKAHSENSEDYFNVTGFLVAPSNAEPGQFLQITAVNREGRVTQVESGFPQQDPADWNAQTGEPGHILNKPFYETEGNIKKIDKKFLPDDVGGVNLSGAAPGQMILVKSVDEKGKPTEWEAVDPITGADWNANEEDPGHILNRPFYSTYQNEELLASTTLTASSSFGGLEGVGFLPDLLDIQKGITYAVIYNGQEYLCTARDTTFQGIPCCIMGNSFAFGDPNTGEPFLLCAFSEEVAAHVGIYGGVIPLDGSATFTVCVVEKKEIITAISKKYLVNARCQKKYVLNFDKKIMPPIEEVFQLDTAEMEASFIGIVDGVERSVMIQSRVEEYIENFRVCQLYMYVPLLNGVMNCYIWDNVQGLKEDYERWTPEKIPGGLSGTFMLVKQHDEDNAHWRRTNEVALPGIVLSSKTQGSQKKFLITVDDSGTLTAAQTYI